MEQPLFCREPEARFFKGDVVHSYGWKYMLKIYVLTNAESLAIISSVACADMAELADALDLGSSAERRGGSSPFVRTK